MPIQMDNKPAGQPNPSPVNDSGNKANDGEKKQAARKSQTATETDPIALKIIAAIMREANYSLPAGKFSPLNELDKTELDVASDWTKLPLPVRAASAAFLRHFDAIQSLDPDELTAQGTSDPGISIGDIKKLKFPLSGTPQKEISQAEKTSQAIAPDLVEAFRKKFKEIGGRETWLDEKVASHKLLMSMCEGTDFDWVALFEGTDARAEATYSKFRILTKSTYCTEFGRADAEALSRWINTGRLGAGTTMEVVVDDNKKITDIRVFADSFGAVGSPALAVAESYIGKELNQKLLKELGPEMKRAILKAIEPHKK